MSPIATVTYDLLRVVCSSDTCGSHPSVYVCLRGLIFLYVQLLSVYLCFACVFTCEQIKQDALCHSQIYNSGTQRGMNTLVSVADEGDEQRRGVM